MQKLKAYFLTGLIVVIPASLTIYLLVVVFNFIDNILGRFLNALLQRQLPGFYLPGLGFILFFLVIFLAGVVTRKVLNRQIISAVERGFAGLPLIRTIYPAIKQVVLFVSSEKQFGFKKVVLVEYPRAGSWVLGFLTNEQFDNLNKVVGDELVSIFVPTTPGPLTGNLIFVGKSQVRFPEISVGEAVNLILSGGVFKGENKPA
jgi:uncharacterized membrane protein